MAVLGQEADVGELPLSEHILLKAVTVALGVTQASIKATAVMVVVVEARVQTHLMDPMQEREELMAVLGVPQEINLEVQVKVPPLLDQMVFITAQVVAVAVRKTMAKQLVQEGTSEEVMVVQVTPREPIREDRVPLTQVEVGVVAASLMVMATEDLVELA